MSVPISGLPAAAALTGTEQVPVVQSSVTKRTTTQAIAGLVDIDDLLPTQVGHSGQFLTTDGTTTSWGTPAGGSSTQIAYVRSDDVGTMSGDHPGVESISWNCGNEGTYQVNFGDGDGGAWFAAAPCVTVTPILSSDLTGAQIVSVSTSNVVIRILNTGGTQAQRGFHLHAMGEAPA